MLINSICLEEAACISSSACSSRVFESNCLLSKKWFCWIQVLNCSKGFSPALRIRVRAQILSSPGVTETPSLRASCFASSFDPAFRMTLAEGPTNTTPASSTAWIKSASSAMKPYPAKRWVYECLEQIPSISSILSSFSSREAPM